MRSLRGLHYSSVVRISRCFVARWQGNVIRYISISINCLSGSRRFTDKHEWISVNENIGTVGISHHAQKSLGEIDFAQLPDVGTVLEKEVTCGALESVKAASEIFCPVSGKVIDKNASVEHTPRLINSSCYDKGWLFKVELTKPDELNRLMTESEYETFIKSGVYK
ncbi:Glycine cleavage system H protein, mitochondrial [Gryllus bimaculatus]|nr:Glycine cleavage system H protein, mitochondrial [Gryllus bimaculatus]